MNKTSLLSLVFILPCILLCAVFSDVEFAQPLWFFLLLLIPLYLLWYLFLGKKSEPALRMSDTSAYRFSHKGWRVRLMPLQVILRIIAFTLIVIVLARPQTKNSWKDRSVEGIDIMLAMDVSTSMLAEDLKPNRIEAAKAVAATFVANRPNDNIGLTIFAGEAFTRCPLTTDHVSLLGLLNDVRCDIAERGLIQDGTAIGMGLAVAVSRMEKSETKSKVIILLTDGSNNMGDISPLTAAATAKSKGIRVYTVAVGTNGTAPYPLKVGGVVQRINMPVEVDTKTLKTISATTDGKFFRATNTSELSNIYQEIDQLEKTRMNVRQYSKRYEAYQPWLFAAILIFLLEVLARITIFRKLP